jgi:hypothetical protein
VKFYTKDGNWDLVGNNIAVFFIQDAIKLPDDLRVGCTSARVGSARLGTCRPFPLLYSCNCRNGPGFVPVLTTSSNPQVSDLA